MDNNESWQQQTLEKMLMASIKEQRARRRWGIFFKLFFVCYLVILLFIFLPTSPTQSLGHAVEHTAMVRIHNEISAQSLSSADQIIPSLTAAFENPAAKAIILELNSPGGSPVQAGEIHDEIIRLRRAHPNKPVYAVISDMCASGCYYIAVAANEIYANEASLVGSIGVIYNGFGFVDAMQKIGLQRRVLTAGVNKAFLDPFSPINAQQEDFMKGMLEVVHHQFISKVQAGRGDKLVDNGNLYSGLVWTAEQAIPLGLVDKLGSARMVAREVVGHPLLVDYTQEQTLFDALSHRFGVSFERSLRAVFTQQGPVLE